MKNIILVLIIYLIGSYSNQMFGQVQQVPTRAESSVSAIEFQTLENNFEAPVEMLPALQLDLFQKKSQQQVKDLIDLINLLSSKSWKAPLKEKLENQAIDFFTSPTDSLFFLEGKNLSSTTINDYLNQLKIKSSSTSATTILETSSPTIENDKYNWTITFQISEEDNIKNKLVATCILQKEKKLFGKIEKEIWNVCIKEIRELSK